MRRRMLWLALIAAVFAALPSPLEARGRGRPEHPVTVALSPYMGMLRTIDVEVGGRTVPFLFDTGGGETLVTPALAELLGREPFGRATGYRMSGERIDFRQIGDVTLTVNGFDLYHETVGVFDLMSLLPEGWPELGGIVSLKSFRGQALEVDLAKQRLVIHSWKSYESWVRGQARLTTRVATGVDGGEYLLCCAVDSPKGRLWLMLDSGNLAGILLAPHAARMLGLDVDFAAAAEAAGADPDGFSVKLDEVTLDVEGLGPVTAPVTVREMIHDGMLSASFMAERPMLLDLSAGVVWCRRTKESR